MIGSRTGQRLSTGRVYGVTLRMAAQSLQQSIGIGRVPPSGASQTRSTQSDDRCRPQAGLNHFPRAHNQSTLRRKRLR